MGRAVPLDDLPASMGSRIVPDDDLPGGAPAKAKTAPSSGFGDTLRSGLRRMSPILSGVLENPQATLQGAGNAAAGLVRGAGSIGATILAPVDVASDAMAGKGLSLESNRQRRADMDAALQSMGANPDSLPYQGGKLSSEIAGTMGVGGLLARGALAIPGAPSTVANALASGGMRLRPASFVGPIAPNVIWNQALRAGAGGTVGLTSAGLVDTDSAGMGGVIGAVTPGVLQLAGKFGSGIYNAVKGGQANAGKMLADAMGVSTAELQVIIKALNAAPESIVPGSKLTVSQALQNQNANQPGVKMLTKIVGEGPGGNLLMKRYVDQGAARLDALTKEGAQTYQGATATESENVGNRLGAMLRTQNVDENAAVRSAWGSSEPGQMSGVHGRAVGEGTMLQLPIDRMKAVVSDRMGPGYTGGRRDVDKAIREAELIGTYELPGLKAIPQSAGKTQSLEQAVRSQGGIKPGDYLGREISELGRKQSKTTGLVSRSGRDVEAMAATMHERGFIPDNDPATLLGMLRSGGGRNVYANDHVEAGFQRMAESAAGDMPKAERIAQAVPFKQFQALRSSTGEDAARLAEKTGNRVEAGALTTFEKLLAGRADDAAMGNLLPGESMSPGLMADYNAARDLTRDFHGRWKGGNIGPILRKPVGEKYSLGGNEITNKLWHGGMGLADDVSRLKQVLSGNNREPGMNALRQFIMTEAAGKTTAAGNLASGFPKYIESRTPALQEAMNPNQLKALLDVASDIRNSDAAANMIGMTGSDTYAKLSNALNTGVLDSTIAQGIGKIGLKGINLDLLRAPAAEMVTKYKGRAMAELLANPKAAAAALADAQFVKSIGSESAGLLRLSIARVAPILAAD